MSNEITVSGTLQYANPAQNIGAVSLAVPSTQFSITGKNYVRGTQVIPTTSGGTVINLGAVSTPGGWFMIKNNDATNYVSVLAAVSGTNFARLMPGEFMMGRFDAAATAPAAIAHTSSVTIEYIILEN